MALLDGRTFHAIRQVGGNWRVGVLGLTSKQPASRSNHSGKMQEGKQVELYTLTNSKGIEVAITNYGGTIVSLKVPDRTGKMGDVVLGFGSVKSYLQNRRISGRSSGATAIASGTASSR